jgi:hypothetical protein
MILKATLLEIVSALLRIVGTIQKVKRRPATPTKRGWGNSRNRYFHLDGRHAVHHFTHALDFSGQSTCEKRVPISRHIRPRSLAACAYGNWGGGARRSARSDNGTSQK